MGQWQQLVRFPSPWLHHTRSQSQPAREFQVPAGLTGTGAGFHRFSNVSTPLSAFIIRRFLYLLQLVVRLAQNY